MLLTLLSPQSQQYKHYPQQSLLHGWGGDLMYPRNNATPPIIDLGEIVLKADGTQQTTGVSARVKIGTGAWGAAAGSLDVDATSGVWTYTPTQSETNADYFIVAAYKSACTSVSKTIITSNSATAGQVRLEGVTHTSAVIPTVTTTTTATNLTNLPSIPNNWLTAAGIAADAITDAKVAADVTIASVTGSVGSVAGNVSGSVGSVVGNVGGNVTGSVASVVGAVGSVAGLNVAHIDAAISSRASQTSVDGKPNLAAIEGSTVIAKEATVAARPTLGQIETSTVLPTKTDVQNAGLI